MLGRDDPESRDFVVTLRGPPRRRPLQHPRSSPLTRSLTSPTPQLDPTLPGKHRLKYPSPLTMLMFPDRPPRHPPLPLPPPPTPPHHLPTPIANHPTRPSKAQPPHHHLPLQPPMACPPSRSHLANTCHPHPPCNPHFPPPWRRRSPSRAPYT